jgi:hypothetical protein
MQIKVQQLQRISKAHRESTERPGHGLVSLGRLDGYGALMYQVSIQCGNPAKLQSELPITPTETLEDMPRQPDMLVTLETWLYRA